MRPVARVARVVAPGVSRSAGGVPNARARRRAARTDLPWPARRPGSLRHLAGSGHVRLRARPASGTNPAHRLRGEEVTQALKEVVAQRARPERIQEDNGSEMAALGPSTGTLIGSCPWMTPAGKSNRGVCSIIKKRPHSAIEWLTPTEYALQTGKSAGRRHPESQAFPLAVGRIWGDAQRSQLLLTKPSLEMGQNPRGLRGGLAMKPMHVAVFIASTLTLSACGSHAASPAVFCREFAKADGQMVGLLSQRPIKPGLVKVAGLMDHLADIAPAGAKASVETEASAWRDASKTGTPAPLNTNAYKTADAQLTAWVDSHCNKAQ